MDTRTTRRERTDTDKMKKRGNWVHAFNAGISIDIQQDRVKDNASR